MEACRACLVTEEEMIPLDETFVNAYNILTSLNIAILDAMPQYVCLTCVKAMRFCMEFRDKCITTETSLQEILLETLKSQDSHSNVLENKNDMIDAQLNIKHEVKQEGNDDPVFDDCLDNYCHFNEDLSYYVKLEETEDVKPKKRKYRKKKCTASRKSTTPRKEQKIKIKIGASGTELACGLCKKTFLMSEDLRTHVESHKGDRTCTQCTEIHDNWPSLLGHRFKHIPRKDQRCHMCWKSCLTCVHMEYHYMKEHCDGEKSKLSCKQCCRSYDTPRQLSKHVNHSHSDKCFICDYCSKTFNNKQRLITHLRSHSSNKTFVCDLCGFSCKHKSGLKDHTIRKHAPGKVTCKKCLRVFATAEDRDKHTCNTVTKICPICGIQVSKRFGRHLQAHSTVGRYSCPRCPAVYKTRQAWQAHMNRHDGVRPKQCEYCPLKFYTSSVLIKHRRIHTGEKPYVCKVCHKGFTGNHNLKVHMKVHGEDLVVKRSADRPVYLPPEIQSGVFPPRLQDHPLLGVLRVEQE
ncbi:zinc finger protein 260-like [Pectinophora gossypiella]|uniref:zinc finger protein 260-like n=1 Tax=Pectinophora gossypiella TaxID=13191 RepID=UPI00214F4BAB|nr:zinc finger protein 260-like [Pectinophora gossypiella]